jgi:hypothetical protein
MKDKVLASKLSDDILSSNPVFHLLIELSSVKVFLAQIFHVRVSWIGFAKLDFI